MNRIHQRTRAHRLVGALLALVLPVAIAACGDDDGPAGPTSVRGVIAPVVVDAASLDGTTVGVHRGQTIDVRVAASDSAAWRATVADPGVVEFVPGRVDGAATFNPGLRAVAPGTSSVTLTDPTSGSRVGFTVDVAPA